MKALILASALFLAACAGDAQTRATVAVAVACDSIGVSLKELAPLRANGKLSETQIHAVTSLRNATRPICLPDSSIDPAKAVTFVEAAAAQLKLILGK